MAKNEMQEMLRAAAILSGASLIAKVLSAFYRVPYQNLVGDEGFYVYQQIYPFYGLAMTLGLSGLPVFLSKILQEKKEESEKKQLLKNLYPWIFYLTIILFAGLFLGSRPIAQIMGDEELSGLIRLVSFMYLLTPFLSFLRGNFQGIPWMTPTALSQVGEQFVRVFVIIVAAIFFSVGKLDLYDTGMLAFSGGILGGVVALIILRHENNRTTQYRLEVKKDWFTFNKKTLSLGKRLVVEGGLIFIYSGLLLLYQLVDSFMVKSTLEASGMNDLEAKVAKGIFDRGQPFVQLGLVISLALASTFLPMLTRQFVKKNQASFERYSLMFLRLTTTLALACTLGLVMLLPWLNFALFKDNLGENTIQLFLWAVFLVSLIQAYENILQSQNNYLIPLKGAFLGLGIKIASIYFLTYHLGTLGSSWSTVLGLLGTLLYLGNHSGKKLKKFYTQQGFLKKLLGISFSMGIILFAYETIVSPFVYHSRLSAILFSLLGVVIGLMWFLYGTVRVDLFTLREWLMLPKGKEIWRFFTAKKGK